MAEHVYFVTLGLPLATVLLVFAMRYASAVLQARAKAQTDVTREQFSDSLAAIEARLAEIERILKDVG